MRKLLLVLVLFAMPAWSQVLTHPRAMGLPESDFVRPDPADYLLVLENGLHAYIAEANQVPLVTMSAFIRAGRVSDERQGAAEALADALQNSGPGRRSDSEFKASLREMTAELEVTLHDEWTEVTLNVPVEDLDQALTLFALILRRPSISDANIDRAARSAAPEAEDLGGESGAQLYEGSMGAAVEHFYDVIYKNHPYGRRPTAEEFDELSVDDVTAFHAKYFVPGNVTLAVAGAIDVNEFHRQWISHFLHWEAAEVPEVKQMPPVRRMRADLHHYPAKKLQSWLVIGHELPPIPLEEQAAFEVMNYIMGEYHMNTRMMRNTRYKYGYTNDASSFVEDRWYGPGGYTYRSYSRPQVIENIYENMMAELIRIREEEVSDHEMFVAKGALTDGHFQVRYLDGYALTRSFAVERLRYGNHDRSASYVNRIRAVTTEDVLKAARNYIRPENLQVILLGEEAFGID